MGGPGEGHWNERHTGDVIIMGGGVGKVSPCKRDSSWSNTDGFHAERLLSPSGVPGAPLTQPRQVGTALLPCRAVKPLAQAPALRAPLRRGRGPALAHSLSLFVTQSLWSTGANRGLAQLRGRGKGPRSGQRPWRSLRPGASELSHPPEQRWGGAGRWQA